MKENMFESERQKDDTILLFLMFHIITFHFSSNFSVQVLRLNENPASGQTD